MVADAQASLNLPEIGRVFDNQGKKFSANANSVAREVKMLSVFKVSFYDFCNYFMFMLYVQFTYLKQVDYLLKGFAEFAF